MSNIFKNVANQKIALFAFDYSTGAPKAGDAANITAYVSKDYGSVTAIGDTSAAEMDATNAKGWYLFDLTQAETNADTLLFTGKSSTANVAIVGRAIATRPNNFTSLQIDNQGHPTSLNVRANTAQAGAASTITLDASASATDDIYNDLVILIISGTGAGQARKITDYVGSTKVATVTPNWVTNPSSSSTFIILPFAGAAAIADAVWDEATSGHVTSGTYGQALQPIRAGTAQAGAAGTITLDASASATDDYYNNTIILITGGTGALQVRQITDYVGSTKVATVGRNWTTTPDATSVFVIIPAISPWDEVTNDHQTSGSTGKSLKNADDASATIPTATQNADALLDRTDGVETSVTPRMTLRIMLSALAGKLSGAATATNTFRNVGDTKNRIVSTVDADGNRTAVTVDGT